MLGLQDQMSFCFKISIWDTRHHWVMQLFWTSEKYEELFRYQIGQDRKTKESEVNNVDSSI